MECEFAKGLIYLENKQQPLNKEDNTCLCRLILLSHGHMFRKDYVCCEGCCINYAQRA